MDIMLNDYFNTQERLNLESDYQRIIKYRLVFSINSELSNRTI
jgi:hypothetical protein